MATAPTGEEWKDMDSVQRSVDFSQYAGEVDAAKQRILDIRRSDAEIRLTDHQGRPLKNHDFRVEQTRSDFKWGEQLWSLDTLLRHGYADSARVRHFTQLFKECLNSANCLSYWTEAPRNDGPKHMEFQGEDKLDQFEDQVNWALQNGLTPKGHPIFWSLPKAYPEWLKRYPMDTQWKFIEVRVRNLVARFKGRVKLWDIVNEAMWEPAPKNLPNRFWPHMESLDNICEFIIPVMQWAREEDPDAKYIVNDYGMEVDSPGKNLQDKYGNPVTAKSQRDRYTAMFRRLRQEGASPDGLGIQAHTGAWMTPVEQNEILDDLASSGVPLHITEFWAHTHHLVRAGMDEEEALEKKVDYIAQVMTLAFAHPKVESFYFWGDINKSFGFHCDHNSNGIPTSSNRPNNVYERVKHLLRTEWMTRETVRTDADGVLRFRGFHGDYSLRTQTPAGQPIGIPFSVLPEHSGVQSLTLNAL